MKTREGVREKKLARKSKKKSRIKKSMARVIPQYLISKTGNEKEMTSHNDRPFFFKTKESNELKSGKITIKFSISFIIVILQQFYWSFYTHLMIIMKWILNKAKRTGVRRRQTHTHTYTQRNCAAKTTQAHSNLCIFQLSQRNKKKKNERQKTEMAYIGLPLGKTIHTCTLLLLFLFA